MIEKQQRIKSLEKRQEQLLELIHAKQQEIELYDEDDTSDEEEELDELKDELTMISTQLSELY